MNLFISIDTNRRTIWKVGKMYFELHIRYRVAQKKCPQNKDPPFHYIPAQFVTFAFFILKEP